MSGTNEVYDPKQVAVLAPEALAQAVEDAEKAFARAADLEELRRVGLPVQRLVSAESMVAVSRELHYPDVSALYAAVGEHHASARHVVQRLVALLGREPAGV